MESQKLTTVAKQKTLEAPKFITTPLETVKTFEPKQEQIQVSSKPPSTDTISEPVAVPVHSFMPETESQIVPEPVESKGSDFEPACSDLELE